MPTIYYTLFTLYLYSTLPIELDTFSKQRTLFGSSHINHLQKLPVKILHINIPIYNIYTNSVHINK